VAEVIQRTFGVTYHPAHVSRLLHALRHSVQQPVTRATQRDEPSIQAWWQERWPALQKSDRRRPDYRLDRPARVLLAAHGGQHVGLLWADAAPAGTTYP
jgi:winged helix-turn-helix protein